MTTTLPKHEVEQFSVQVMDSGEGFVLNLANARQEAIRLEFPAWMVHQLMRILPRLDAALHQKQQMASSDLIAYPVVEWSVECSGLDQGVVLCLCNDRQVEIGFHFALGDARDFHRELGEAIGRAVGTPANGAAASAIN